MNQRQLINEVAARTGRTKTDVAEFIDDLKSFLADNLQMGEPISIYGFGSLERYRLDSRRKYLPATGEMYMTEPRFGVRFKPGDTLVKVVNDN